MSTIVQPKKRERRGARQCTLPKGRGQLIAGGEKRECYQHQELGSWRNSDLRLFISSL